MLFWGAGPQGEQGPQGDPGTQGEAGPLGPPFANAVVDGVERLGPGDPVTVSVSFDGSDVHFSFGIPKSGPGEVTMAQMDAAIATNALKPDGAGPLTGSFSDPPTQAEREAFVASVETLRVALVGQAEEQGK